MNYVNYINQPWDKVKTEFDNFKLFSGDTYLARHAEPCSAYAAYKNGREFLVMVNKASKNVDAIKDVDKGQSIVSTNVREQ
ncbi:hypothetical protein [Desulfolucanica intricata]|uniref:hypothetical protein n=1 Tax=Desulfolucanica intricata TaxID=1285191 RepID=UPI0008370632|nr:hypothetical protein [Desulfolucanica intricata]